MLIVLTDGVTDQGMKFDDLSAVIAGLGIPVHTIGFEADLVELEKVSGLVEGAISIDADIGNVGFEIARLFNREL